MQKIIINRDTLEVCQIINLDKDSRFSEDWYYGYIIKDDVDNKVLHHGYKYIPATGTFEEIEGHKEPEVEVEEKEDKILELQIALAEEMEAKDAEILDLKMALAEQVEANEEEILSLQLALAEEMETKAEEILNLQMALAEIVEGGL